MKESRIRRGVPDDLEAMLAILPRLAEFELPARRRPGDLWEGDARTLRAWAEGGTAESGHDDLIVLVADHDVHGVVGLALVRLQPEFMSRDPGAHLEAIGVAPVADGHGVGRMLLTEAERAALAAGARSMTLHVFANNERARSVYERTGYEGELLRYVKHLVD